MNQLMTSNQPLTMSTREIAKLLNKQHSNIKVSAERLAERGTIAMQGSNFEHNGNVYEEYLLEKRDCFVLVAQNCPEFTAAIVDRWQELEEGSKPNWITQLSPEARIAIEDLSKQVEVKDHEIERLQGVCNTVTAQFAPGLTISTMCKQFNGVNIMQVNNKLIKMGMLVKTKHGYEPSSYARDNYFTVSYESFEKPNGDESKRSTVTLTLKGAKWLYKAYLSNKLPMKKSWDGSLVHVEFEVKQG